ncbi:MAG: sulfotransferase, partial [bacterium]|nr:sulfotransferase [bacterium]
EAATRQLMQAHLASNPRGKHGAHHYSLEDFGLDRAAVQMRFAGYCERFGIPSRS